ncbi:MAG: hypothetical protein QOG10_4006 [Kribbellaceae bacterium]|nr:hypothetical protein [Kribbellaceae bacterium]
MGSTRRSGTGEYKEEAVNFVVEGGRSVAEVARNIGVHEMTLGRWVRKAKDARDSAVPADAVVGESERNPAVTHAIATIAETAWTPVHYPGAVVDPDTGELISDAEVAETQFTTFASQHPVTARAGRAPGPRPHQLEELFHHHPFTDLGFGAARGAFVRRWPRCAS